jgi:hypothetical protein
MEEAIMEQALRPYAIAGAALLGASMIAATPMVKLPSLPEIQTSAVQLTAEADAFAVLVNVLDPEAFANGISATPTDALGSLAVSGDALIDSLGTPYITAADNLATDLLPLLDITSLFNGLSTTLGSLLTDLTNLPNLSTLLSELGNLPTATDIANALVAALTGAGGALTTIDTDLGTITSDLTGLPTTITTDLINALTGAGGSLTTITGDLGTITTDLGGISSQLGTITTDLGTLGTGLNEILTHLGLTTILGL